MFDPFSSANLYELGSILLFCQCTGNRYYNMYKKNIVSSPSEYGKGLRPGTQGFIVRTSWVVCSSAQADQALECPTLE